jgi:hypothetical protein
MFALIALNCLLRQGLLGFEIFLKLSAAWLSTIFDCGVIWLQGKARLPATSFAFWLC